MVSRAGAYTGREAGSGWTGCTSESSTVGRESGRRRSPRFHWDIEPQHGDGASEALQTSRSDRRWQVHLKENAEPSFD
jgi:hypothetical protein